MRQLRASFAPGGPRVVPGAKHPIDEVLAAVAAKVQQAGQAN